METAKRIALAGLIAALTAAKLMWPATAEKIRENTRELIECRGDYAALAEAMGRSVAGEESGDEIRAALGLWGYDETVSAMGRGK